MFYRCVCTALLYDSSFSPECEALRDRFSKPPLSTKFHGWSPGPIGPFKGNNRGNKGKSTKIYNFDEKSDFALYGRWEALVTCKILPRGLGTISTPGKHISEKLFFLMFLTNLASHEIWHHGGNKVAVLCSTGAPVHRKINIKAARGRYIGSYIGNYILNRELIGN